MRPTLWAVGVQGRSPPVLSATRDPSVASSAGVGYGPALTSGTCVPWFPKPCTGSPAPGTYETHPSALLRASEGRKHLHPVLFVIARVVSEPHPCLAPRSVPERVADVRKRAEDHTHNSQLRRAERYTH